MAAFWWGTLAAVSLVIGALLALLLPVPKRVIGLVMLADTMAPEAYENGGRAVGLVTTAGFLSAFLLTALA